VASGYNESVEVYANGRDALNNMYKNPSFVTLDYSLPDISGEEVLRKMRGINSELPVVVVSSQEDVSTAIGLLRDGAYDYVVKNQGTNEHIKKVLRNVKEKIKLHLELTQLKDQVAAKYSFNNLIGHSESINRVYNLINKASGANINVSLHGEIGVGKELIAKTIHYNSIRKDEPFIAVDLRSLRVENFSKEVFGEEFHNGDSKPKIGYLERANKGTLFLEGFEDLDKQSQILLEKFLQTKEFFRVGGSTPHRLDIRLIMSYNSTLAELVSKEKIVEHHYYKTMGIPIDIPPLRERDSDVIFLANKFIRDFATSNNLEIPELSPKAKDKLLNYNYPGNVQELKAIIELAVVMSSGSRIEDSDVNFNSSNGLSKFLFEEKTLKDYTRGIIKHFLQKYDNNVLLVADKLDVGKSTIYRMIKNKEI